MAAFKPIFSVPVLVPVLVPVSIPISVPVSVTVMVQYFVMMFVLGSGSDKQICSGRSLVQEARIDILDIHGDNFRVLGQGSKS